MPLTDTKIKKPLSPGKYFDGKGLFLHVISTGAKYWRYKYRHGGKEKLLALGVYPEVSLKLARERHDDARKLLKSGVNPTEKRREIKREEIRQSTNSFEAVAREWFETNRGKWKPDHAARVIKSLGDSVFNAVGGKSIEKITARDLLDTLRVIEKRGALETSARTLQRCKAVFRYAIATDRCVNNPAADLRGVLKTRPVKNYVRLSEAELPEFLRKLDEYDGQPQTKLAIRLLMLTFVRTGELRPAREEEFDRERAEWRIPAQRMKMGQEHIVPLSRQALEVLDEIIVLNGDRKWLFVNQQNPEKYLSENTILYALYRMGYHSRMTGHGFRGLASTILHEQGFTPDAIERQLAHSECNKVKAAYNAAQYLPERRRMMQHWGDYLDGLRSGAKVKSKARKTA